MLTAGIVAVRVDFRAGTHVRDIGRVGNPNCWRLATAVEIQDETWTFEGNADSENASYAYHFKYPPTKSLAWIMVHIGGLTIETGRITSVCDWAVSMYIDMPVQHRRQQRLMPANTEGNISPG
ncbi:uncharacterized protein PG986_003802 [Apiospora aurea]|uniref:Uncharacterized protein n=1 Tax=Apiospora aurea TaxID=335848 RepID=A0ABR1QSP8_9PEZI